MKQIRQSKRRGVSFASVPASARGPMGEACHLLVTQITQDGFTWQVLEGNRYSDCMWTSDSCIQDRNEITGKAA